MGWPMVSLVVCPANLHHELVRPYIARLLRVRRVYILSFWQDYSHQSTGTLMRNQQTGRSFFSQDDTVPRDGTSSAGDSYVANPS